MNTDGTLFRQALDHVLREYGRAVVRGVDDEDRETEWDSAGGGTIPVKAEVLVEGEPDQIPAAVLVQELTLRETELEAALAQEPDETPEADGT